MRNNGAITQNEALMKPDQKLISSTDLRGIIVHCNDAFAEISGFSREELIGQNHNIVRHPDMPEEAFELLWKTIQAGQPWMGLVKNRCKNGDYYWVSAYITPVTDKGKVVGYESVRSCPNREDVQRAERLYSKLKQKKPSWALPPLSLAFGLISIAWLLGFLLSFMLNPWWGFGSQILLLPILIAFLHLKHHQTLKNLQAVLKGMFMHPLAAATYTSSKGTSGQVYAGILSMKAHLDAVLTRMEDASGQVAHQCHQGLGLAKNARHEITQQHDQSQQVATAMHQMTTAINDISNNVQETASTADRARLLAVKGREVAAASRDAIGNLRAKVFGISHSVDNLAEQTNEIAAAAEIIEQIAEKTNLLALNAAIEAARAGDYGRGFSVVADEVRNLATSTQESTNTIRSIVASLETQAKSSVVVAREGTEEAEQSVRQVAEAEEMLESIADAVERISEMATQMATAVEEQSHVAEDVNTQIEQIADLATSCKEKNQQASQKIERSKEVSDDLHELVIRFRQVS
ncbi:methyl-accepting chemotaxis sensory transducer with Pas/Pac sensor [Marinospirillum celere]|uniref:Methyl-accepting chemotaxis sensory transducer with Pas/Pac sensor n=1 Tax=Marinospirillum celere TaxID=1122252 RepID=A0A1I1IA20_9GAMM|nr:PAS domain-containing methyl-accepting chemotaxis protein [Marinospirillum celere]SFC30110.1 methyl-accepting chemotaxis sensory transducer with Pas/Pac sensor [Marinospirillum celere]